MHLRGSPQLPRARSARGLRVGHVGRSSVRYEIALFAAGSDEPAASGHFVHVYVDRESRRPTAIPDELRKALSALT